MSELSEATMRDYMGRSIASLNRNKLNGLLAEIEFRAHLTALGFADRVSRGGWVARRIGAGEFAHETAVFFPETIQPNTPYLPTRALPQPDTGLHTICATFHQTGIAAYFCAATVQEAQSATSVHWRAIQLGLPTEQLYQNFPAAVETLFTARMRRYNYLRYNADVSAVPARAVAEEFSKENLRVVFQTAYMAEVSDIDGILWGERFTYPLEIKEKTAANDNRFGEYFGLDTGPFVKLAYYAAKRSNLNSLFVVREIENVETRQLVNWWFIRFETLATFASWVPRAGGPGMGGGASSVVCIPKSEFQPLTRENLQSL